MGLKIGNYDISQISVGNNKIGKVYYGNNLIYESRDLLAEYLNGSLQTLSTNDLAGITTLGINAFAGLPSLKEVNLPSTFIDFNSSTLSWAESKVYEKFDYCTNPMRAAAAFQWIFKGDSSLKKITFSNNSLYNSICTNNNTDSWVVTWKEEADEIITETLIYVPEGFSGDFVLPVPYIADMCNFKSNFITSIDASAIGPESWSTPIEDCTALESFYISPTNYNLSSITVAPLFKNCNNLQSINFGGTPGSGIAGFNREFGSYHIFYRLPSLTSVSMRNLGLYEDHIHFREGFERWDTESVIPSGYYVSTSEDTNSEGNTEYIRVLIPNTLTTISIKESDCFTYLDFEDLRSLTTFNFGSIDLSGGQIYEGAFRNCINLTRINYVGTIQQWRAIYKASDGAWHDAIAYDPQEVTTITMPDIIVYCSDGTYTEPGRTYTFYPG